MYVCICMYISAVPNMFLLDTLLCTIRPTEVHFVSALLCYCSFWLLSKTLQVYCYCWFCHGMCRGQKAKANLQVIEGELAGGFLVELQRNLQLVQFLSEAGELCEVIKRHLKHTTSWCRKLSHQNSVSVLHSTSTTALQLTRASRLAGRREALARMLLR